MAFPLTDVQRAIAAEGVDGWLFYDFQGSDPIARRILSIPSTAHMTRRWFYFVPRSGEPSKMAHKIEPAALDHLPGEKKLFASWRELEAGVKEMLSGRKKVAMNYSPGNAIPYVSRVDAGTLELVRASGPEVVSSADLIQQFEAVWTDEQLQSHIRAAKVLRTTVDEAFAHVASVVTSGKNLDEYALQQFILGRFEAAGLISDYPPIVAIGPHAGNPHYSPEAKGSTPIKKGEFLLIDIWAREKSDFAVYADITWTGFLGKEVPQKFEEIFQIVRGGRDAGLRCVEEAVKAKRPLRGAEVDDATRGVIEKAGYGKYFVHRTGHSIGRNVHGNGANIDNYETREERKILPHTCFSIEPGIYMPEFGVRSEIDVYVGDGTVTVYGQPIQTTVVPILK